MGKSKSFIGITGTIVILLVLYFVSSILRSDFWGNILSPIIAFFSAGILIFSYIKSQRTIKISITYLLYAVAIIAWGIADVVWGIVTLSGGDPYESTLVEIIYAFPNFFLLLSLVIFAIYQYSKWDWGSAYY